MSEDVQVDQSATLEYWHKKWEQGDIGFHKDAPYHLLMDNLDDFIAGKERMKVLIPLCGKAKDMIMLSDLGHSVVGIECSQLAVAAFFEENNIKHSVESVSEIQGALLYKNDTDGLHVYVCDLFDFTVDIEGTFQGIWDRGSIVAIAKEHRVKYCKLMRSLMARDCHYFLVALEYDDSNFIDAPHSLGLQEIQDLLNEDGSLTITSLARLTREPPRQEMKDSGITVIYETLYLLKYRE